MKVLASDYDGTLLLSMNFVSLISTLIFIFYVQEHLYLIKKEKSFIKVRFLNIYYMNFMIVIKKIMTFLFKPICKSIHF